MVSIDGKDVEAKAHLLAKFPANYTSRAFMTKTNTYILIYIYTDIAVYRN